MDRLAAIYRRCRLIIKDNILYISNMLNAMDARLIDSHLAHYRQTKILAKFLLLHDK